MIDTRHERESTQILARQVAGDRHSRQTIVRSGVINLRLLRDRIGLVNGSSDRNAAQTRDRSTRIQAQISGEGSRASIGHRRSTQNRETPRRAQDTCEHQAILQALHAKACQRLGEAFRAWRPARTLAGPRLSKQSNEIQVKHSSPLC